VNVAVTTASAAADVRRRGGIPHRVERSAADLDRVSKQVESIDPGRGTAWWVDVATNRVVVEADSTVTGTRLAKVRSAVDKLGPAATLTTAKYPLSVRMSGGDKAVADDGGSCSAGFNVQSNGGGPKWMLTAGHCAASSRYWTTQKSKQRFAETRGHSWPASDYGIARYLDGTTVVHNGDVNLYNGSHRDITGAADVVVGQYVARTGATSGFREGKVLATGVTANYGGGTPTRGLVMSTACSAGGDSGGPFFSGNTAFGLLSGGSGECGDAGAISLHQPVKPALAAFGVRIY
jgi:streptogrisin D